SATRPTAICSPGGSNARPRSYALQTARFPRSASPSGSKASARSRPASHEPTAARPPPTAGRSRRRRARRASRPASCAPTVARNTARFEKTPPRLIPSIGLIPRPKGEEMIKVAFAGVWVHDQDEALAFYTDKLGWELRADVTLP